MDSTFEELEYAASNGVRAYSGNREHLVWLELRLLYIELATGMISSEGSLKREADIRDLYDEQQREYEDERKQMDDMINRLALLEGSKHED